jgi:hypothetical protein
MPLNSREAQSKVGDNPEVPDSTIGHSRASSRQRQVPFRTVGGLVRQGLLKAYYNGAAFRISCASIDGFLAGYSFLSSLGKKFGLSVLAAVHLCESNEIDVYPQCLLSMSRVK